MWAATGVSRQVYPLCGAPEPGEDPGEPRPASLRQRGLQPVGAGALGRQHLRLGRDLLLLRLSLALGLGRALPRLGQLLPRDGQLDVRPLSDRRRGPAEDLVVERLDDELDPVAGLPLEGG